MPTLAIYTLIALALFSIGFGAAYKVYQPQVDGLNLQIKLSNEDARRKQLESVTATERAEQAAQVINLSLEAEHDKNIKLNSDLSNSLATVRMRVPTKRPDCTNTLPKDTNSGIAEDSADSTELPDDFKKLLRSETLRADNLAAYASECFKFISTNCGIKQ